MGMKYELNWYIVGEMEDLNLNRIAVNENVVEIVKSEPRVYPIGSRLPLIAKGVGCLGMGKITKNIQTEESSTLTIEVTDIFEAKDEIAMHFYNYYMNREGL